MGHSRHNSGCRDLSIRQIPTRCFHTRLFVEVKRAMDWTALRDAFNGIADRQWGEVHDGANAWLTATLIGGGTIAVETSA